MKKNKNRVYGGIFFICMVKEKKGGGKNVCMCRIFLKVYKKLIILVVSGVENWVVGS